MSFTSQITMTESGPSESNLFRRTLGKPAGSRLRYVYYRRWLLDTRCCCPSTRIRDEDLGRMLTVLDA